MEKSFRMLEQVLQDVHVLLQCGERMLLGQVAEDIAENNNLIEILKEFDIFERNKISLEIKFQQ